MNSSARMAPRPSTFEATDIRDQAYVQHADELLHLPKAEKYAFKPLGGRLAVSHRLLGSRHLDSGSRSWIHYTELYHWTLVEKERHASRLRSSMQHSRSNATRAKILGHGIFLSAVHNSTWDIMPYSKHG